VSKGIMTPSCGPHNESEVMFDSLLLWYDTEKPKERDLLDIPKQIV